MKKFRKGLLCLLFWLAVWELLALRVGRPLLLPGPAAVGARILSLAATAVFWQTTALSLGRILLALLCGVAVGTGLAVLSARFSLLHDLLSPLLSLIRATPVASFIILALLFLGRDRVPPFIAALIVVPVLFGNVEAGIRSADPQLLELAKVYRFPALRTLRRVYLPAVLPFFRSACETSLGLAWKAGVAAEVLTLPQISIGRALYTAKLDLETADLFAWTAVTVLCSIGLEQLVRLLFRRKELRHG